MFYIGQLFRNKKWCALAKGVIEKKKDNNDSDALVVGEKVMVSCETIIVVMHDALIPN